MHVSFYLFKMPILQCRSLSVSLLQGRQVHRSEQRHCRWWCCTMGEARRRLEETFGCFHFSSCADHRRAAWDTFQIADRLLPWGDASIPPWEQCSCRKADCIAVCFWWYQVVPGSTRTQSLKSHFMNLRQWFEWMEQNGTVADYDTYLMLIRSA